MGISIASITKDDEEWDKFGKLLKLLEKKDRSSRIRELVEMENRRLEKKLMKSKKGKEWQNKDYKL